LELAGKEGNANGAVKSSVKKKNSVEETKLARPGSVEPELSFVAESDSDDEVVVTVSVADRSNLRVNAPVFVPHKCTPTVIMEEGDESCQDRASDLEVSEDSSGSEDGSESSRSDSESDSLVLVGLVRRVCAPYLLLEDHHVVENLWSK
jgi:hypothetical protein